MSDFVQIGSKKIGSNQPTYIIAEIGINHNGDLAIAKELIDVAVASGCDAVKFQKRTPDICTPKDQRDKLRQTPWGEMTYLDYRYKIEFEEKEYREIENYCKKQGIDWFVSCWDEGAVDFTEQFEPVCYKVASATLTDDALMKRLSDTKRPIILSTGMSSSEEIERAVSFFDRDKLLLAHATSTYPCLPKELNLKMIDTLKDTYNVPVGYSGHEVGLQTTLAAVAMGACLIERHITLDRSMWGSDQAASVEPEGLRRLVRDIRVIEEAIGDGVKKVYESELPARARLRRVM